MTSADFRPSPWKVPEYLALDRSAKKFQLRARASLALELCLEVGAGFVAIGSARGMVLAALIMLALAVVIGVSADRFRWSSRWREARSQAELVVSRFWRDSVDARLDDDNAQTLARSYLKGRVIDQQLYYSRRAREFTTYSRVARTAMWALYGACAAVAALEVLGKISVDAVGPAVALVASIRVWGDSHEWERTAGIYTYFAGYLSEEAARLGVDLASEGFTARDLATRVESVEDGLSSEAERWLALHDFDLFDQRRALTVEPARENILDIATAWDLVKARGGFLPQPHSVTAERLSADRSWRSRAGDELVGRAGDWLLNDGVNEWTIVDHVFRKTYEIRDDGSYSKSAEVRAARLSTTLSLVTIEGPITLHPGDWLVCNLSGDCWGMSDNQFAQKYQPSTDATH